MGSFQLFVRNVCLAESLCTIPGGGYLLILLENNPASLREMRFIHFPWHNSVMGVYPGRKFSHRSVRDFGMWRRWPSGNPTPTEDSRQVKCGRDASAWICQTWKQRIKFPCEDLRNLQNSGKQKIYIAPKTDHCNTRCKGSNKMLTPRRNGKP